MQKGLRLSNGTYMNHSLILFEIRTKNCHETRSVHFSDNSPNAKYLKKKHEKESTKNTPKLKMKTQKLIEANKTIVGWNENRIQSWNILVFCNVWTTKIFEEFK